MEIERTSWKTYSLGSYHNNPRFSSDKVLDNLVGDNHILFIATINGGRKFQYLQIDFGVSEVRTTSLKLFPLEIYLLSR